MTELLTPEVLLRYPIVFLLGVVLWWSMKERRDDRIARNEGAKDCHVEQRIASEAIKAAAEAIGGIKAATEAQNSQLAAMQAHQVARLDAMQAQVQQLQVIVAQCLRNASKHDAA